MILTTISNEEIWEKQKKIYKFNVIRQNTYENKEKAFIISKL